MSSASQIIAQLKLLNDAQLLEVLDAMRREFGSRPGVSMTTLYRDPENHFNTWKGVGRRPQWLTEALENGYTLPELEVGVDDGKRDRKLTKLAQKSKGKL